MSSITIKQIKEQLSQLNKTINLLTPEQISTSLHYLHSATIGQHIRHILEMFQCVLNGYEKNEIDYINRQRNLALETNKELMLKTISEIEDKLIKSNKNLCVKITETSSSITEYIQSNYEREILYNLDHILHHLAIVKVGLIELNIPLENTFLGVAYSTIKYKTEK